MKVCLYLQPQHKDMDPWFDYINDLLERGNVNEVCIVAIDQCRWITSDKNDILRNKTTTMNIIYKEREYTVTNNDGLMMRCVSTEDDIYLFVAKTRQYVIAAMIVTDEKEVSCNIEVETMRAHLDNQGK